MQFHAFSAIFTQEASELRATSGIMGKRIVTNGILTVIGNLNITNSLWRMYLCVRHYLY